MANETVTLFGIRLDLLTMGQAVERVHAWLSEDVRQCRYVVTPNVDHVVKLQSNNEFRAAYQGASMVVVDGKPVLWASRLVKRPLPSTVPGSDLVPAIFDACGTRPLRVYLLGAGPGVADRAAAMIAQRWPAVEVCGTYSPPMGFEKNEVENVRIVSMIEQARPDLLVIGLGAPKQELWVHAQAGRLPVKVALCVGATIDFLAGEKKRAPHWMRRVGLEWLYRALSEPRRLLRRYLTDALIFPGIVLKELISGNRGNH